MLLIELYEVPELLSRVSGIVPKETHESNRHDRNSCEHHCRDYNEHWEAAHPNRHVGGDQ